MWWLLVILATFPLTLSYPSTLPPPFLFPSGPQPLTHPSPHPPAPPFLPRPPSTLSPLRLAPARVLAHSLHRFPGLLPFALAAAARAHRASVRTGKFALVYSGLMRMSLPGKIRAGKSCPLTPRIGPVGTEPKEQLTMSLCRSCNAPPTSTPRLLPCGFSVSWVDL